MVRAQEMPQVSQLQWRDENGGEKTYGNQKYRTERQAVIDKYARLILSRHLMLCSTSSDGIFPLSTERCVQIYQSLPVFT